MKRLPALFLCLAVLLLAGTAHAYAIYNHVNHQVKVYADNGSAIEGFIVPSNGVHNGEPGSGLKHAWVQWTVHQTENHYSPKFNIPDGGFIRIYENEVKIYDRHNKHLRSKGITCEGCLSSGSGN